MQVEPFEENQATSDFRSLPTPRRISRNRLDSDAGEICRQQLRCTSQFGIMILSLGCAVSFEMSQSAIAPQSEWLG